MNTIFIADFDFNPRAKVRLKRFLEERFKPTGIVFLLFDRDDQKQLRWRDNSIRGFVYRKLSTFAKRLYYFLLPQFKFIESKSFRKAARDSDEPIIVVPYFDQCDELVCICSEYLHDLPGNHKLFVFNQKKELKEVDLSKPELPYIEYHVCWHCNLKCKGCGHHSNLYGQPRMGDLDQYVADLERLSELFRNIRTIHLLGGEPLLNKELPAFIRQTRRVFAHSSIAVVTNGLPLPQADKAVFQAMKDTDAHFMITCYPVTENCREAITRVCEQEQVKFYFSPLVRRFTRQRRRWRYFDPNESFRKCKYKYCHFLNDGKISVCPAPQIQEQSKQYVPVHFRVSAADSINLYDPSIRSGYDILDRFNCSIPFCRYCDSSLESFRWEGHHQAFYDFR